MNRFGLLYETKDGKKYLYKSYNREEGIAYTLKNDDNFKKLEKEKVFIVRLSDSDIKEIKEKEGNK